MPSTPIPEYKNLDFKDSAGNTKLLLVKGRTLTKKRPPLRQQRKGGKVVVEVPQPDREIATYSCDKVTSKLDDVVSGLQDYSIELESAVAHDTALVITNNYRGKATILVPGSVAGEPATVEVFDFLFQVRLPQSSKLTMPQRLAIMQMFCWPVSQIGVATAEQGVVDFLTDPKAFVR